MGALADAALAAGGRVVGIIPQMLMDREVGHTGPDRAAGRQQHGRAQIVDGGLCRCLPDLPGGIGTMDELFEAWSWTQLGLHDKPSGLLNFQGYYDRLGPVSGPGCVRGLLSGPSIGRRCWSGSRSRPLLDQLQAAAKAAAIGRNSAATVTLTLMPLPSAFGPLCGRRRCHRRVVLRGSSMLPNHAPGQAAPGARDPGRSRLRRFMRYR